MNKKWAYILALSLAVLMPFSTFAEGNKTITPRTSQSVLSSGNWAKVSVSSSGIYMLTNSALSQMGFSDPSKVAVFGNGGSHIPFSNSSPRIDDLKQLPVLRTDKGILFYAEGTITWNASGKRYSATVNPYSTSSFYFITDSSTPGIVPSSSPAADDSLTPDASSSSALMYVHHEENSVNLQKSGREWYGEELKNSRPNVSFDLDLPARSSADELIYLDFCLVSSSASNASYTVSFNGTEVASGSISGIGSNDYARSITRSVNFKSNDTSASKLTVNMSFASAADQGWIDYVTATTTSPLDFGKASQISFSTPVVNDFDNTISYSFTNSPASLEVWDVTKSSEPLSMPLHGSSSFVASADNARTFVAFNTKGSFNEPSFVCRVANQNLHSQSGVNYVIITDDEFLSEAQRLADAHRLYSGFSVAVATCSQIYNEFSSGKCDVTALRDYIKMVYDRGLRGQGDDLRCVLLFGQGSYNNRLESDNNRVPTYQSANSLSSTQTYVTDDFFGWLDDTDGASDLSSRLDIGIGRFPCSNIEQARNLVNKSITYLSTLDLGSWKAAVTFASDDGDENEHLINAEKMASRVEELFPDMVVNRIFLETYKLTQTSVGTTYAKAHTDFMEAIEGSAVVDYVGHASSYSFTGEGLFHQNNIISLTNKTRLPLLITAACDFCPFDHNIFSGSEEGLIYPNGGFIGVLGASRVVYSTSNYRLNNAIYDYLFANDQYGRPLTIGEAISRGKVASGALVNSLKYVYLGDPALTLPRQQLAVSVNNVNGLPVDQCDIPLQALTMSSVKGSILTSSGDVDTTFNGNMEVTIFDKRSTTRTSGLKSSVYSFEEYKNPVYKGTAEVHNGQYTFNFMLSKDIDPDVQYGRVFFYAVADSSRKEAYGAYNQLLVGGIADDAAVDDIGPSINAWIDFEQFHDGQVSGANPVLYATIEDPSGINTSGLGAGHDLCIYINGDRNNAICLNSYFAYDAGSHTRGTLTYRFNGIDDGLNCLTLKAWDNVNNSASLDLNLKVVGGSDISFGQIGLFPSPLDPQLQPLYLSFSHNDGGYALKLTLRLYATDGRLIDSTSFDAVSTSTLTGNIDLSAIMPNIRQLTRGLYLLKVDVNSSSGRKGSFTKRLSVK